MVYVDTSVLVALYLVKPLCSLQPLNALISPALLKRPDVDGLLHA